MMKNILLAVAVWLAGVVNVCAEDGSRLWLRMPKADVKAEITAQSQSPTTDIAVRELQTYWKGAPVTLRTDSSLPADEGFVISRNTGGITISAHTPAGLMYGAYELLRRQATGQEVVETASHPSFSMRMLNHWDNLDLSIERGYAGRSIWKWDEIDGRRQTMSADMRKRLADYGRANASIGLNATVLNNVNASPKILSSEYLKKVKAIADALRPYNIKVYLSVNFASPMALGGLPTADPLDDGVARWWRNKADEIYREIPDFGGFLVKANSEGQPGPGDYDRTHADGANMLAAALEPHHGLVIWRCFVYGNHKGEDRVKQAVTEFSPVDGRFRSNVILQAKNGPLDFQPREPYSPVFDRIQHTPLMGELQITQEYLGQSRHLVYLAPMWKEFFGFVPPSRMRGIAGVANIGDDANWCGHHFSQANWYAFGRLAWDASLSSRQIADEWLRQTFSAEKAFLRPMLQVMETSREACVDYMMPLGLHHIFKADHHYGPEPDGNQPHFPIEWKPIYYHKADSMGVGFDRTRNGTDAVSQYRAPYADMYDNIDTCPEEYLLWFHHVPWTHRMKDGQTLWQSLCMHYNRGVEAVEGYVRTWRMMKPYVDSRRYEEVAARMNHQLHNAHTWRDTCLSYFSRYSRLPITTPRMFLLGGELSNSAATSVADIDEVMPRMREAGLDAVLIPVYWELTEPVEGSYDFTLVDRMIDRARDNGLRIVPLWFGAWKNSMSCYAPMWLKQDTKRFPRACTDTGKPMEIASCFSENVFRADSAAFMAVVRHIALRDTGMNTVAMIQVENEIGMLESARDHSTVADSLFAGLVPQRLLRYLADHRPTLHPQMLERWKEHGCRTEGTWEEVFGRSLYTDEIFMAWHYGLYVERLARAARAVTDVPLYVNAAMNSRGRQPGEYPSAGPLAHLKDIWHCAAPTLDMLAPDIYDTGFKRWASQYALADNPLFIPETRSCINTGVRALYAFGEHGALGFSPFAIDQAGEADVQGVTESYALLRQLRWLIGNNASDRFVHGVLLDKTDRDTVLCDGDISLTCRHYFTLPWDARATDGTEWPEGGAVIVRIAPYEYLVAGSGVVVSFASPSESEASSGAALGEDGFSAKGSAGKKASAAARFTGNRIGLGTVDEVCIGYDGTPRYLRRNNGDQTHQGRHVRISVGEYKILHVRLYRY